MFKQYKNEKVNEYIMIKSQDVDGSEILDTEISINAEIVIAGSTIKEFADKIEKLINEYRI
jgi:hypothetical protein